LIEQHFDLDGIAVRVRTAGAELDRVIERLLGPYQSAESKADIEITIDRGKNRERPGRSPRFKFPPLEGFDVAGGWFLRDDVGFLEVDLAGRVSGAARADADMSELSRFAGLPVWVALLECLRARGRFSVHAAALVTPAGETVLLAGTKAAGKSTATLALAERGFTVLTDDMVFVTEAQDIIGYAKRFHVRPDLIARRPDLLHLVREPEPYEPQDKKWLALAAPAVRRAPAPSRIYFSRIVDAHRSEARPLSPRDTLLRLLEHSAFVFVEPQLAPRHLAALRTLADRAQGFELLCGRDLLHSPDRYRELAA
jgi:hypothetical protein